MFNDLVTTEPQLRTHVGHPGHRVPAKHVDALDANGRAFIARSPFLLVASADGAGSMDVSPKGDAPGFVLVLDDKTLAIPDRPGNRKADTFSNLIENRRVGLLFMIPGKQETLRVSGSAAIVRDQWLRERLAAHGKTPELALAVNVEEVFFHCAKCVIARSCGTPRTGPTWPACRLSRRPWWTQGAWRTPEQMQALIDQDIRQRLY